MDLETLKQCWQEDAAAQAMPALEGIVVMDRLQARAAHVRRGLRRRLRREATYYVPTIAVVVMSFWGQWSWTRVGVLAVFMAVMGGILLTLWQAEQKLIDAPLDRGLREVLADLLAKVDEAGRRYLTAYVVVFAAFGAVCAAAVYARHGTGPWFGAALLLSAAAVVWSYFSGRAYVSRMFRSSRTALEQCLRDLENNA